MRMNLFKTVIASMALLACGVNAAEILKSRNMTQVPYSGAGTVLSMGTSQNTRAFFEQDFKKMTIEQKEYVALNLLRELVFFNIGPDVNLNKMAPNEKEIFVNKNVTDPVHARIRNSTIKVVKDLLESTDFNDKSTGNVANLKRLLVKIDILVGTDKGFDVVNLYRENRFEQVFDTANTDEIWKQVFASKFGPAIMPQVYIFADTFDQKYSATEVDKMFETLKTKK